MDLVGSVALSLVSLGVSVIFGAYFYVRSRRVKEPCWDVRTTSLVDRYQSRLPSLAILYDGREIESLAVSRIIFWNAGRDTIWDADLDKSYSPIRIVSADDVRIYDVDSVADNLTGNGTEPQSPPDGNEVSRISVEAAADGWRIRFRYLEPGRGGVFQVIHTSSDSEAPVLVSGSVVGGANLRRREVLPKDPGSGPFLAGMAGGAAGVWVIAAAAPLLRGDPVNPSEVIFAGVLVIIAVAYVLRSLLAHGRIPTGLETFSEDVL